VEIQRREREILFPKYSGGLPEKGLNPSCRPPVAYNITKNINKKKQNYKPTYANWVR